MVRYTLFLLLGLGGALVGHAQPTKSGCEKLPGGVNCKRIADFESDTLGAPPAGWYTNRGRTLIPLTRSDAMGANRNVYVRREDGNQFARISTDDYGFRVIQSRKQSLSWNLGKRPYLRWRWRAQTLPAGANEKLDGRNDTGGAVYVTFGTDWLGRPKSIKYTYSSSLAPGTTVDFGPLKVLVVASKPTHGLGRWITHERNVLADYRRLFGEDPDPTPLAVAMWSDSDSVNDTSVMDFDDVVLLSRPTHSDTAASR